MRRLAVALALALQALPAAGAAALAERFAREERAFSETAPPPYFDGRQWRWETVAPLPAPEGCTPGSPPQILLASPRVDLFRCQGGFPATLVGSGPDGSLWTRPLRHPSGPYSLDLYVGSANAQRITLDTLEGIDAASGRTLQAAPMKLIDTPPRAMPVVRVSGPVACPADGGDCFGAVAEGEVAGLLRIARDGRLTVLAKPQAKWFAPIAIADIQIAGDRLLLAEEWLFRGTKWVRFAIVDATTGRRLFEERHGEDRVVGDPRIVVAPNGELAFHYRDATAGRQVMVRYRLAR